MPEMIRSVFQSRRKENILTRHLERNTVHNRAVLHQSEPPCRNARGVHHAVIDVVGRRTLHRRSDRNPEVGDLEDTVRSRIVRSRRSLHQAAAVL